MSTVRRYFGRFEQRLKEKVGLAAGTEDSDFQAANAEYKGTVDSLRHLAQTMRAYITATKKQMQTSAALSVELAAFHRGTSAADGAMALGQAHAEMERIQLAAVERLYEEYVIAATELLLWQVPEVEEKVRQRKTLLLDRNIHRRKYESVRQQLADNQQNHGPNNGFLRRGKSEAELSADLATRKVKLEHAEAAVDEVTEWCLAQFETLLDQRESGNILGGPMAAFLACQRKIMGAGAAKLDRVRPFLPLAENFDQTLSTYESEFAKAQALSGTNLFDDFTFDRSGLNGSMEAINGGFGVPLPETCPLAIREAIDYLEQNGGLETEGLFRVGGSQDIVQELRDRYNAGETGVLAQFQPDAHDVAALIKRFLADLPESLIPQAFYQQVVSAAQENDGGESLVAVIEELPESHIVCLSTLLMFLYRLARRADKNKMTFVSIATCLAPTVVRAPQDESPIKIMEEMQSVIQGLKLLIEQAKRFDLGNAPPRAPSAAAPLPPRPTASSSMAQKHVSMSSSRSALPPLGNSQKHGSRRMSMRRELSVKLW